MLSSLPDEQLALRFQTDPDPAVRNQCVNELFGRHQKRVALWCLRMTGEQDAALDLAQDIFMKAYRHLGAFRSDAKFSTWLYSITRNHCLNFFRSRSARPEETEDSTLLELADLRASDSSDHAELVSQRQFLERLLAEALDETERKVFVLHFVEEFPLDAITRQLGLTNPSGARAHLVSAKRKLNKAIERWKARREPAP